MPKNISINYYSETKLNALLSKIFSDFIVDRKYKKVIVTCSDSPFITPELIANANNALEQFETLFISPSSDGGYSLIGLNKFVDVFSAVIMSTNNVLEHTLTLAISAHLNIHKSQVVDDIDTEEDIYAILPLLNDTCDQKGVIRKCLQDIIDYS